MMMLLINNYFTLSAAKNLNIVFVRLSPSMLVFLSFDLAHILYILWNCIRIVSFTLHIIHQYSFIANNHVNELNQSLKLTVVQTLPLLNIQFSPSTPTFTRKRRDQVLAQTHSNLGRFYVHFRWMVSIARKFNSVISPLAIITIFPHMALNLLLIGNILFRPLPLLERMIMLQIACLQIVYAFLLAGSLISVSQAFYRSDGLLYRVQQVLLRFSRNDVCNVAIKRKGQLTMPGRCFLSNWNAETLGMLKLATFYETICSEDVFRFTVGHLVKLNWRSLQEFFYVYSVFVMYISTKIRNGRL